MVEVIGFLVLAIFAFVFLAAFVVLAAETAYAQRQALKSIRGEKPND